jgi:hypothetical protein
LRTNNVETEAKIIRLQIDADPRLAAGVGGAVRYLADAAGMENDATAQLQGAVVAACKEAFEHLTESHPHLNVTLTRLSDRIEVALSYEGDTAPAVGLDTIAKSASQDDAAGGGSVLNGVDRIQYETQGKTAVTRLTKYISQGAPSR